MAQDPEERGDELSKIFEAQDAGKPAGDMGAVQEAAEVPLEQELPPDPEEEAEDPGDR